MSMPSALYLLTENESRPVYITGYPLVVVAWWDETHHKLVKVPPVYRSKRPAGWLYRKETDHANPVHAR